jgi:hypothetical protein
MSACRGFDREPHDVDEVLPTRGMYARFCSSCREARAATQRRPRGAIAIDDSSFEGKARSLVSVGRRVDRAIADVKKHEAQRREVRRLAAEALEAWKATCARLAGVGDQSP